MSCPRCPHCDRTGAEAIRLGLQVPPLALSPEATKAALLLPPEFSAELVAWQSRAANGQRVRLTLTRRDGEIVVAWQDPPPRPRVFRRRRPRRKVA